MTRALIESNVYCFIRRKGKIYYYYICIIHYFRLNLSINALYVNDAGIYERKLISLPFTRNLLSICDVMNRS